MIAYRPMEARDRQFVISGWASSLRTAHSAGLISMSTWADVAHREIEIVLDRPDVKAIVAYETTEQGGLVDLYGFVVGEPDPIWSPIAKQTVPLVFYCYVKAPYRCRGIASGLFGALGVNPSRPFAFVCKTSWCSLLSAKIPQATWDPLVGRFPREAAPEVTPKVEYRHGTKHARK